MKSRSTRLWETCSSSGNGFTWRPVCQYSRTSALWLPEGLDGLFLTRDMLILVHRNVPTLVRLHGESLFALLETYTGSNSLFKQCEARECECTNNAAQLLATCLNCIVGAGGDQAVAQTAFDCTSNTFVWPDNHAKFNFCC